MTLAIGKMVRRENSGLMRTPLEHAKYEQRLGHTVSVQQPDGTLLVGPGGRPDVYTVHSQISLTALHDGTPKVFICHGEPLSSVGNGISMRAILDLAPAVEAFICMRQAEVA